jgi:hypothetical protein
MKTAGGIASSYATVAILTALFEHLMKTGIITSEARSAILADAIVRLRGFGNASWLPLSIEVVNWITSDLTKSGF